MKFRSHWIALAVVMIAAFAVLLNQKRELDHTQPPIPERVVAQDGRLLFTGDDIRRGQNTWQSLGGHQMGSIWGHGAYLAPDWTADYLHRECESTLDQLARAEGASGYAALSSERQAALRERLRVALRGNHEDEATQTLTLSAERTLAFEQNAAHYAGIFRDGKEAYAIPRGTLVDPDKARAMATFFFWTSWAASTSRPGADETYTMNWPHDPLAGNEAPKGSMGWSMVSVVLLLGAVAALVFHHARSKESAPPKPPSIDPLLSVQATPSQKATYKYFAVVALLLVLQVTMGIVTAHYGVEGSGLYGIELSKILPYAVTRTWHTQLGVFWIATAWLAVGLWLAPLIGHEPRYQRAGVNVLFGALLVVVGGALFGTWASVKQRLGGDLWYWLGHQGWEYVELGRVFQIGLFVGLLLWLGLMVRALWPAFFRVDARRPLLVLFVLSTVAIALFYGAGFMYGKSSHLSQVEYWRWWVVHLWVEGFFEVFATAAIAYLLVNLGLIEAERAVPAVLFATTVFLGGGVIGTLHHLYFTGAPASFLAFGAVFSALEVAPLSIMGFEVVQNLRLLGAKPWMMRYKWPLYFFIAVAFWNLVGAGLFGFLINPPVALYHMQGLNLTPVHGHTALFGVYGMLGIGLALFALRALDPRAAWSERPLAIGFWALNGGLVTMVLFSLLPIGILQTQAAVEQGTWWARSDTFLQQPIFQTLRWMRAPGDTLFAVGALAIAWFFVSRYVAALRGPSAKPATPSATGLPDAEEPAAAE
ncbi:MAG: nitric-oxide reductase large subunit [Byssovorax sp.]